MIGHYLNFSTLLDSKILNNLNWKVVLSFEMNRFTNDYEKRNVEKFSKIAQQQKQMNDIFFGV